ncbi:MAG: porin, partial [Gemmatimonadales bacterium]
ASALAQAPTIQVQGRIQVQYRNASGDSSGNFNTGVVSNGFEVRRLRIQTNVRFGDNMNLSIQPSFEMGALRMRDAFLRVGLTPKFGVTLGQEKSPFQRYELISSNTLPSIERGVRILGLSGKEGLNDLLTNNGYTSHDLGAFVDYAATANRFTLKLGVSNGARESATDVNNAKSFFGRATAIVLSNSDDQPVLQIGGSFGARDRAICSAPLTGSACTAYFPDSSKQTTAFGFDLEYGGFRPGLHVIADFAMGDNVPAARRGATGRNAGNIRSSSDTNVVTFRGVSLVGAYRIMTAGVETRVVKMIEPALRVDATDPDDGVDGDGGLLITPVLNVYFGNTVVLRAGLDIYRYKNAAGASQSAREIKVSWQANF